MKKLSVKKLSVLGLVLMAASAVTAAILPNNSDATKFDDGSVDNGVARIGSGAGSGAAVLSCVNFAATPDCHLTAVNITFTGVASSAALRHTAGNTSASIPDNGVDITSVVS